MLFVLELCGFLTIILLLIHVKYKYFKSRVEKILMKVPGPEYHYIFGNSFQFLSKREDRYPMLLNTIRAFADYPFVRLWFGHVPNVLIGKAEVAEVVLSNSQWTRKGQRYNFVKPWLGDGLLISGGEKWKARRRMLTPAFHFGILEKFLLTMNEKAVVLTQLLKKEHLGMQAFDFYSYATRCTLDVICETAMGSSIDSLTHKDNQYLEAVHNLSHSFVYRLHRPWLASDFVFKFTKIGKLHFKSLDSVHEFTRSVINKRRKEYIELKKKGAGSKVDVEGDEIYGIKRRLAFLDLLLHRSLESGEIDEEGIQEEVDTFMFAVFIVLFKGDCDFCAPTIISYGHDTTASGISWIVYNIGRMPQVQQKIREELIAVLGDSPVDYITSNQLGELKFLESVIKESLRLFPPVPLHSRQLKEDIKLCGYDIPAGTVLWFSVKSVHTDVNHYPDPLTFDPNRFIRANDVGRHPYSFIPFAAGPRNCIGQRFAMLELKTVTAHIFHRFQVNSVYNSEEDLHCLAEFVLRPLHGHYIRLTNST